MQFRFPIKLRPGQIFGIYEIMFIKKSMFKYKTEKTSINAFFIRRSNFRRLLNDTMDLGSLHQNFLKFILLDYIQQIYLPIQQYQDHIMEIEHQKQVLKVTQTCQLESSHSIMKPKVLDQLLQQFSNKFDDKKPNKLERFNEEKA